VISEDEQNQSDLQSMLYKTLMEAEAFNNLSLIEKQVLYYICLGYGRRRLSDELFDGNEMNYHTQMFMITRKLRTEDIEAVKLKVFKALLELYA
jgi:hypothetical protein